MQNGLTINEIAEFYRAQYKQTGYPFNNPTSLNLNEWIKIKIKAESSSAELLSFIIAVNEIFRFEIGKTQPACKLSPPYLLSKRILQDEAIDKDKIRTLYFYLNQFTNKEPAHYWQGMGRVIFCKYVYQQNDFNLYNAIIDKNNYFIGLDLATCFWSITEKYYRFPGGSDVKVLAQNNSQYSHKKVLAQDGRPMYVISSKKRNFMGNLHKTDYEMLPYLKHAYPADWFFIYPEIKDYSYALAKETRFLNEKYFSTLKCLITPFVKHLLIDLHILTIADKQAAIIFIDSQMQKLTEIVMQSTGFVAYLKTHGLCAMQTIMYEILQFFKFEQDYYLEKNQKQLVLDALKNLALIYFENLLVSLSLTLTEDNKNYLHHFYNALIQEEVSAKSVIKNLYANQLMDFHAQELTVD